MNPRSNPALLVVLGALLVVAVAGAALLLAGSSPSTPTPGEHDQYPDGAGENYINFTALDADDTNVSHAPRAHWDAFAVVLNEPADRERIEGDYHVNSTTGEILETRWDGAEVYLNGSEYAFVHPAESVREHERTELEDDPAWTYHEPADAYYKWDPVGGLGARTNLGLHTEKLAYYTWTASDRTTHHGVPVITYRVTGERTNETAANGSVSQNALTATNGTLKLGADDGLVYAYDLTLTDGEQTYRYTYAVRPAPFPDHEWVETARRVAGENASAAGRVATDPADG